MTAAPLRRMIEALVLEHGRPLSSLIALSNQNDPFNADTPAQRAQGEWFAGLYRQYGFGLGVHLRRIHYRLVSQEEPVRMVNGKPYENTVACWGALASASAHARYLGLVPIEHFVDRRNPPPVIGLDDPETPEVECYHNSHAPGLELPSLGLSDGGPRQPYHVELWCEKSTIADILRAAASRYHTNVVMSLGEQSLTSCLALIGRAIASERPVRILYISDFDPGGRSMPLATARHIEWLLRRDDLSLDIQVRTIVLTHDQCIEYELPRTPIKETERRAAAFEKRFGDGATELDALEALHSGELRRIIETEVERYYDATLDARWQEAKADIERILRAAGQAAWTRHVDEIEVLETAYSELGERAGALYAAISDDLREDAGNVEIPGLESEPANEDGDPLFDSKRDYIEQINRYKLHQGKPTAGARS